MAGADAQDVVLAGEYVVPQDELLLFRVEPGTVSGAKIVLGCPYYFKNVRFNSGSVTVYGQNGLIENCIFDYGFVRGDLFVKAPRRDFYP